MPSLASNGAIFGAAVSLARNQRLRLAALVLAVDGGRLVRQQHATVPHAAILRAVAVLFRRQRRTPSRRAVALDNHEAGDGSEQGDGAEEEVGADDVAVVGAPGKDPAGGGGPHGTAEGAEHGGEAVEGAEDAQRRARVGEQDGGGGEGDDDAKRLEDHDADDGEEARALGGEERGEWRDEVDDGQEDGCDGRKRGVSVGVGKNGEGGGKGVQQKGKGRKTP